MQVNIPAKTMYLNKTTPFAVQENGLLKLPSSFELCNRYHFRPSPACGPEADQCPPSDSPTGCPYSTQMLPNLEWRALASEGK